MAPWGDATIYSRGQRGRVPPTAWETTVNGTRIWLGKGHPYHPNNWVVTCRGLRVDTKVVCDISVSLEEAQQSAIRMLLQEAESKQAQMEALVKELWKGLML